MQGMGGSCCLNRSVSIVGFSIERAWGINEMAGYTTCRFSRRDTCGFSSKVKQIDIFYLFSGHIKRLLTDTASSQKKLKRNAN
jgi:hypothetical protein